MKLNLSNFFHDMMAGALSGLYITFISTALATLVFKGLLLPYFAIGMTGAFLSLFVINFTFACFGVQFYSVGLAALVPGAILALIFTEISQQLSGPTLFPTLIATLMISSLMIGIALFSLGYFRLGHFVRFLPYPVIGGFIAGIGWIVLVGGISIMIGSKPNFLNIFKPENFQHHIGGIFLALVLLFTTKKFPRVWLLPAFLLAATLLSHLLLALFKISTTDAIKMGWLSTIITPKFAWQTLNFSFLQMINWTVIFSHISYLLAMIVVIVLMLLLNISSLEIITQTKAQFDKELKTVGIGNFLCGIIAAFPVNLSVPGTLLNKNTGAKSRFSVLVAGSISIFILFLAPGIISFIPKPVIGGLLIYVSLNLLVEWLYTVWFRLPLIDCFIIVFILLTIAVFGLLPGVAVGIIITCAVFIITYSRVKVVKYELDGDIYHSKVIRPLPQQRFLTEQGKRIKIYKLQGFLFFGSVKSLVDRITNVIETMQRDTTERFFLFDFQLVNAVDSSAIFSFMRLKQLVDGSSLQLVLTGMSKKILDQFRNTHVIQENDKNIKVFKDIDHGLEWCENILLSSVSPRENKYPLTTILSNYVQDMDHQQRFLTYLEKIKTPMESYLFHQGDYSNCLYFIESGEVSILHTDDNKIIRLSRGGAGTIVGEMGFYLHRKRSASIRTETDCVLYKLTEQSMQEMEKNDPDIAMEFHQGIIRVLAARLTQANFEVSILSR